MLARLQTGLSQFSVESGGINIFLGFLTIQTIWHREQLRLNHRKLKVNLNTHSPSFVRGGIIGLQLLRRKHCEPNLNHFGYVPTILSRSFPKVNTNYFKFLSILVVCVQSKFYYYAHSLYNSFKLLPGHILSNVNCFAGAGKAPQGGWTEQSQVVVETVTKTSTTQKFSAVPTAKSDASKVISKGMGLKTAMVNKETTFQVDASQAGT